MWKRCRSTDKRYPGDNRLIFPKSPYRRDGLAPQHLGCASRNAGLESAYNGEPLAVGPRPYSGQYRGKSVGSAARHRCRHPPGRRRDVLRQQWKIDGTLNRDKDYYRIRVSVESTVRFVELIEPHLLPMFRYKLPQVTP